ncbi:MAG TPA: efflux RND transporter periplasmic adaptor subunit [Candidatus Tectomicrobia bacterium]|jgi:RND family efflux transporter MFP subunit
MKKLFYRVSRAALSGLLLLLTACTQQSSPPPATPPPPKVTVSQPLHREVVEWEEYTGRLDAVESVEIRARVSGYLQSVNFKDGGMVKKGDLLFVVDPRPYQAELQRAKAELAMAIARFEQAEKDLARAQLLLRSRAMSEEEVETRSSARRQAQESIQAARATVEAAQLNVEFTQVRAPISGRISRNFVSVGNLITGGAAQSTLLTTIMSLDPIYCYFETDERTYLKEIRRSHTEERTNSQASRTPVYLALADEAGFPHKGSVDFVDNRLDPGTGTITARAVVPNPDLALTPGLFARVRVPTSDTYRALLLPSEAVGSDLSQQFVFVVNDQNLAEYRKVTLGPIIDGLRVIRNGLQPDNWVIVNGIQRVKTGARVDPVRQGIPERQAPPAPAPERTARKQNGRR